MLAYEASGPGRACQPTKSGSRPPQTTRNIPNRGPSPCTVTAIGAEFNSYPLGIGEESAAQAVVSPPSYHETPRGRVNLAPFVLVGLLGLAALYLASHIAAALLGWQATAAIATIILWAWAMHSLWSGARR